MDFTNNGDNTFQNPKVISPEFSYATGWRVEKHPRFMADIRNTGRTDTIGFADRGVFVSVNNGDEAFSPSHLATKSFGYSRAGWRSEKHPRLLISMEMDFLISSDSQKKIFPLGITTEMVLSSLLTKSSQSSAIALTGVSTSIFASSLT